MTLASDKMNLMSKLLIHSDLRGFDFSSLVSSLSRPDINAVMLDFAFESIESLAAEAEIFLPAFNYDFTATRIFDPLRDVPQVGRLPMAAMGRPGWFRSRTPVFSFLSSKEESVAYANPFSEDSFFSELRSNGEKILLLGVGFERFTFIHHVEYVASVPYRYEKEFGGVRVEGTSDIPCEVTFHVRPLGLGLDYDFSKIGDFLVGTGAAVVTNQRMITVDARSASEVLLDKLADDEFFLLSADSRGEVEARLQTLGRPFMKGDFE